MRRSRLMDVFYWLRSRMTGKPFLVERDNLPAMRKIVEAALAHHAFDAIHADQLSMAQFVPLSNSPDSERGSGSQGRRTAGRPRLRVFDAHNAVWKILERMRDDAPWYVRPLLTSEAARVRRFEGQIARSFDLTLAVTEEDRQALSLAAGDRDKASELPIEVVPIAVDASQFNGSWQPSRSEEIVTLGTLHYPPNADGIRWFARVVFPLIRERMPQASLTIIGRNPPRDLRVLAESMPEAVRVTGYVPDLDPYFKRAGVVVVPVRAGGGMRVRLLECFARGLPTVTTQVGLEGIKATPGHDVLVADRPEDFAESVLRVLGDGELASSLGRNARHLVQTTYDWTVVMHGLDQAYQKAAARYAIQH
jgi:polysaccharide biosynthesis protein PslH